MVIYKNRRALEFVDGGLEAFEEQADMVAVDETVVCREGDVDHPSPVALHIFAPIDSGDGIVRILHAWITCLQRVPYGIGTLPLQGVCG